MLPGYTHNIINLSQTDDLVTVMWASEARKEGNNEGREDEIKSLIRTKLRKGKSIPQIADELERDETTIKALIQGMGDEAE